MTIFLAMSNIEVVWKCQWTMKSAFIALNGFPGSKETVVLRRWERSKQKFGFIKLKLSKSFTVVIQPLSTRSIKPNFCIHLTKPSAFLPTIDCEQDEFVPVHELFSSQFLALVFYRCRS